MIIYTNDEIYNADKIGLKLKIVLPKISLLNKKKGLVTKE